ncbi:MAG: DNA/RNA helicase domain-containing protein [Gemmatimonadaceae bacterium]
MSESRARYGWESDFPTFRSTPPAQVRERLQAFVADASPEQVRAWSDSIPPLQREVDEVLVANSLAHHYSAILEYELPMESRRPDVVLLVGAGVMVMELKGKLTPSQADIDQAAAYARDLRCYHRECASRIVVPVLVPTRARGYLSEDAGVHIAGPDVLDELIGRLTSTEDGSPVDRDAFLAESAYCPLPTLVEAARELFRTHELRFIDRARAATDPAVEAITRTIHHAAATKTRHLILVTGVPGAGKTLVGLRTVHAHFLDDLAVRREGAKPTTPAVFLSGNAPLVEVLQYELREAGGDGKTFVRGVKEYVKRYSAKPGLVPPEHVLVFDEAQRAFDADMVKEKHPTQAAKSEPEHFVEFAERIPDWCVVIGLIGTGQEIHVGEEAGLVQWRWAVERSPRSNEWTVHAPAQAAGHFESSSVPLDRVSALSLDTELRFHSAQDLHQFVGRLLEGHDAAELRSLADRLERDGFHLRLTRSLDVAKAYLRERYANDPTARFGMIASSKDKDLVRFGVPNDFQSTKRMRLGPWYSDDEDDYGERSCRRLEDCVTEFGAQGLELDASLLAWGTDLVKSDGAWSNANARGYRKGAKVKDPFQLRINAYRVLLTRGRDAVVAFVPPIPSLDETFAFFAEAGFRTLSCDPHEA